jgi:nitroreductase
VFVVILSFKNCFKIQVLLTVALLLAVVLSASAEADVKLPEPRMDGGSGIFALLKTRASAVASSYPTGQVSQEELSTLLWAASGLNRPGKGWTIPLAMGREPYCKVYVASDEGTFLYDWKEHSLKEISKDNIKNTIGNQAFVAKASHVLIFVTDGKALGGLNNSRTAEWGYVAVGAMTQNVYLAADSLNIGVRYMMSLSADVARASLKLEESDIPVCIMPIGKR